MIKKEDIEIIIPNVIEKISKMVAIPSSGIITGQALSNLICEELNLGITGPINDIDFFVPLSLDPSERGVIYKEDKGNFFYKSYKINEKNVQNIIVSNNYPEIFIAERENIKILRSYKDGLRNFTLFNYGAHKENDIDPLDIIKSFDLNCTSVGYLIEKQKLIVTDVFLDYLNTKELKVYNYNSPIHTLYRLDKKINEISGITCNLEQEENKLINYIVIEKHFLPYYLKNAKHLDKMELIKSLPKLKIYKNLETLLDNENIQLTLDTNFIDIKSFRIFYSDIINNEINNGNKNIEINDEILFNYIEKNIKLSKKDFLNFPNTFFNINYNIKTNELIKNIKKIKEQSSLEKLYSEIIISSKIKTPNTFDLEKEIKDIKKQKNFNEFFLNLIKYKEIEFNEKEKKELIDILKLNKQNEYKNFFNLTDLIIFLNKHNFEKTIIDKVKNHFSKIINNNNDPYPSEYQYLLNTLPLDISSSLFNNDGVEAYLKIKAKENKLFNYTSEYSDREKDFLILKMNSNNFKKINLQYLIDDNNYLKIKEKIQELTINYNEDEIKNILKPDNNDNVYYTKLKLDLLLKKEINNKSYNNKKRKI